MSDPIFTFTSTNPFGLIDVGSTATPTLVDIDNDNDLDLFIGDYHGSTLFFRNTGTVSNPMFAAPDTNLLDLPGLRFNAEPSFVDIDDDGDLDAFVAASFKDTQFYRNTGTPSNPAFADPDTNPFELTGSTYDDYIYIDIDSDGDLDAFFTDFYSEMQFYRNTGTVSNPVFSNPSTSPFGLHNVGYGARYTFVDIDSDGDLDAFAGTYRDIQFFRNIGTANNPNFDFPSVNPFGLSYISERGNPTYRPTFGDIDNDGDLDVFVGHVTGDTLFFSNNSGSNNSEPENPLPENPNLGLEATSDNIMVAALNLSARAYSDVHHGDLLVSSAINEHIKNWKPLEATDLGFSATDSRFSKVGGAVGGDLLRYDFKNASATVGLTMLDGKRTLGITFEGTNPTSATDIAQDLINIKNYYTSLKGIGITNDSITSKNDFIQSVVKYINDQSIEQVLVTGHSLGGATAQSFMSEYGQQDTRFIGVTFGSPGTTLFQPVPEDRFVNIQHDGDVVVIAGTVDPLYSINGSVIKVVAEYPANEFPNEHKIYTVKDDPLASYSKTIDYITSQLNANLLFKDLTIGINNSEKMTSGLPGNEIFVGLGGDDTIEGGLGVDTAIYTAPISSYEMNKLDQEFFLADQRTEPNNDGTDTLKSIERIIFTDFALALDLNGSAGMVAKLIGAVFGAGSISNAHYVAIGLSELDKGTSYEDLAALAIDAVGAKSPEQVTSLLWSNVVGSPPTTDQILPYIDMLHKETTVGTLGMFAAEHEINLTNINLTGLVENGIAFDPSYYQPIG